MEKPDYILLIDDDQMANFLNKTMLQKAKAANEIYIAENGEDAFTIIHELEAKAASKTKKLCILLDLDMPLLNGYEFLEELKNARLDLTVQVYVLSILLESREKKHLRKYPVVKFIGKPLTFSNVEYILSNQDSVDFNTSWELSS